MANNRPYPAAAVAVLAAILGGCGGGSSVGAGAFIAGSTTTSTLVADTAEGLYAGTASNGRHFTTLVLENNQYYIMYGGLAGDAFNVAGLVTGTGQTANGNFTSTDLREFPALGLPLLGTLSGTYVPQASFNATATTRGTAVTYPGTVPARTSYVYGTGAKLADIAGAWTMMSATGLSASLNIAAGGAFTGASDDCDFSGTITPRPSGKNVFNVTLRFGPSPCALAGQTVSGHAISYLVGGGQRQLLVAGSDASRSVATVLAGVR